MYSVAKRFEKAHLPIYTLFCAVNCRVNMPPSVFYVV